MVTDNHPAAAGDADKVIEYVKEKGVSITTKNNNGVRYVYLNIFKRSMYTVESFLFHVLWHSGILFGANNGHIQVVKALLELGANIDDRSNNWKTPLLWACLWGHYDVVKFLIDSGADLFVSDIYGLTPVMSAVMNGNVTLVRYLISKGANVTARNYYNGTALTIAQANNREVLIRILQPYFPDSLKSNSPFDILREMMIDYALLSLKIIASELKELFGITGLSGYIDVDSFFAPGVRMVKSVTGFTRSHINSFIQFTNFANQPRNLNKVNSNVPSDTIEPSIASEARHLPNGKNRIHEKRDDL